MERGEEIKSSYKKADQDIAEGHDLYYIERDGEAFWDFDDIELGLARLDLIVSNIDVKFQNQEAEELEFSEAEKKTLNKPFKLQSESSMKYGVYVKNKKGEIKMIEFGDDNSEFPNINPEWKPKYWLKFREPKLTASQASVKEFSFITEWDWSESLFEDEENIYLQNPDLRNKRFS